MDYLEISCVLHLPQRQSEPSAAVAMPCGDVLRPQAKPGCGAVTGSGPHSTCCAEVIPDRNDTLRAMREVKLGLGLK